MLLGQLYTRNNPKSRSDHSDMTHFKYKKMGWIFFFPPILCHLNFYCSERELAKELHKNTRVAPICSIRKLAIIIYHLLKGALLINTLGKQAKTGTSLGPTGHIITPDLSH